MNWCGGRGSSVCSVSGALVALLCVIGCSQKSSNGGDGSGTGGAPGVNTMVAGTGGAPVQMGSGGSMVMTAGSGGMTAGSGGSPVIGTGGASGGDEDAGDMASGGGGSGKHGDGGASTGGDGCTRDKLKAAVDDFYDALAAHSVDMLPLASNVKYTENAKELVPGEGVWKTAGMLKFKRTAVDTMTCMSVTESVISDGTMDRVYGVRLKLDDDGNISEISRDFFVLDYILIEPSGLVNSMNDDWETVLPPDKQMPRDKLQAVMNRYLVDFPSGACGFSSSCTRLEDGGSVGTCVDGSASSPAT